MCTSLRAAGLQLYEVLLFRICPAVLRAAARPERQNGLASLRALRARRRVRKNPIVIFLAVSGRSTSTNPTWLGHSIGRWEGDTLVIDTVGFNDKSWVLIYPHTEMLHVIERYRRADRPHLEVEATIEDPGTYAKPWKQRSIWNLSPGDDVLEYVCNDNNKDPQHITGTR